MEEMETPLDVLSRAASMIETDQANRELAYKSSVERIDHRESPNKELPTKLQKYERMKERHELPQTLNFDKERSAKLNSKKCAGTQTSYSGFLADRYVLPAESGRRELPFPMTPGGGTPQDIQQPSLSPHHRRSPPPAYPHTDSQNIPLNLSLGNTPNDGPHSHGLGLSHQQLRPSVITCASSVTNGAPGNKYGSIDNGSAFLTTRREVNTVGVCDPAIEEHFRRSLGKDYPECLSSKSSSRSSSPTGPTSPIAVTSPHDMSSTSTLPQTEQSPSSGQQEQAVSITGSVDDHFAKSLGDSTWSQIKAKNDPVHFDLFTGSVDDHFAKALGDTWLRIKAEKESGPPNAPSCSSPSSSPRQHSSPIST